MFKSFMQCCRLNERLKMESRWEYAAKEYVQKFNALPDRCKELYFYFLRKYIFENNMDAVRMHFFIDFPNNDECKSPIEVIMLYALYLYDWTQPKICGLYFHPQKEIVCEDHKYYADIYFSTDYQDDAFANDYHLVIECDGHDYHEKTKEQVRHRNERDMDLKKQNIDIIHFSGSQIYNDPMSLAKEVYELIKLKTGGIVADMFGNEVK